MMATRNTPPLWTQSVARLRSGLLIAGQALRLIAIVGLLWAYLILADALMNAPKPTERCFDGATTEMGYCRTQADWGTK